MTIIDILSIALGALIGYGLYRLYVCIVEWKWRHWGELKMGKELKEAKKIIIDHLDEICNVKTTKWVENEAGDGYIQVDAGYSEKEMETMQFYHNRDNKEYIKLRDLLYDLI